jgi:hypothetical protein
MSKNKCRPSDGQSYEGLKMPFEIVMASKMSNSAGLLK